MKLGRKIVTIMRRLLISTIILAILTGIGTYHMVRVSERIDGDYGRAMALVGIGILALAIIVVVMEVLLLVDAVRNVDAMTGIHNQRWIMHKGGYLQYKKKLSGYTAMFMNIKDCKYINQKVGNANGDQVIQQYSHILEQKIRKHGYIGRMGGDNYVAFVKNDYFAQWLEELRKIYVTIEHNGEPVKMHIKVRCGVSGVDDSMHYRELINCIAAALAQAKKDRLDIVIYEKQMVDRIVHNKETLSRCKAGIKNLEFVPYYQPKVETKTGRLCGAEALARWNRDGQIVPPMEFIPLLEQEGEITKLDFFIFERVCQDLRTWLNHGIEPVRVSTNFSKLHLMEYDFADRIIEIKNRYNIDGRYLEVELTESSGIEDLEMLQEFTQRIKKAGIILAIDDFGTGYSSLSTLKSFGADVIKLDKSFLDSAKKDDPHSQCFIRDIIRMVNHQNETILCEGVETKEQLDFLSDAGCDVVQGFYFDKPLPHDEYEDRLLHPIYQTEA